MPPAPRPCALHCWWGQQRSQWVVTELELPPQEGICRVLGALKQLCSPLGNDENPLLCLLQGPLCRLDHQCSDVAPPHLKDPCWKHLL